MVRQDILEGLKSALARGQTLKEATVSFYNSGYAKQDVDEAVQAFSTNQPLQPQFSPSPTTPAQQPVNVQNSSAPTQQQQNQQTMQKVSAYGSSSQPQMPQQAQPAFVPQFAPSPQIVSAYGQSADSQKLLKLKWNMPIYILIALLVLLMGMLAIAIFFKNSILSFFGAS